MPRAKKKQSKRRAGFGRLMRYARAKVREGQREGVLVGGDMDDPLRSERQALLLAESYLDGMSDAAEVMPANGK